MHIRLPRVLAATVTVCTLLSLCVGGAAAAAPKSAATLASHAISTTEGAQWVQFAGVITEGTQRVTLNMTGSTHGVAEGTIGIGKSVTSVREVHGRVYFLGNAAYWSKAGGKSAVELFAGRWVSTATKTTAGQALTPFLDSTLFLDDVFGGNVQKALAAEVGTATVGGKSAIILKLSFPENLLHGDLYVARSGPPFILKIAVKSKTGSANMTFANYNKVIHPVVPANSIDIDTLG